MNKNAINFCVYNKYKFVTPIIYVYDFQKSDKKSH